MPGALTAAIVESEPMRVTRHAYAVDGWGVGELWLGDGRVVLAHEAPSPQRRSRCRSASNRLQTPQGRAEAPFWNATERISTRG